MTEYHGERGPQGDHGQSGPTGPAGPTGAPGKDWKFGSASIARLLAYGLVVCACVLALVKVQGQTIALKHERDRVGNLFLVNLAQGASDGCISANRITYVNRAQLKDAIPNARAQYQQLVNDGTLTQAQVDRILLDAKQQINLYLDREPYRDCNRAADRYLKLMADKDLRITTAEEIYNKDRNATTAIRVAEDKDQKRREAQLELAHKLAVTGKR